MNQPSISVENVWKRYRKGQTGYHTLREDIYNITGRIISLGGEKKRETDAEHIWALKDVSFQIEQGEKVGIIGRNGSGKTTMLRLLAGITRPNHGKISIKGRLGVLIELMAGFHPELSGRENVYLNGAIMGMSQKEIKRKFDEIVAFAELENFIDTPIKRYSSGMHVRLGFSVAAHLDPDILLVDEVLAVGDAAFQKKCLGKMGSAAREGRTVVFVSHNMGAILQLCSRAIVLREGKCMLDSDTSTAVSAYLGSVETTGNSAFFDVDPYKDVQITSMSVVSHDGNVIGMHPHTHSFCVLISYRVVKWRIGSYVCLDVFNDANIRLLWSSDVASVDEMLVERQPGLYEALITIPGMVLSPGRYYLTAAIYAPGRMEAFDAREKAISVEITDGGSLLSNFGIRPHAATMIPLSWKTKRLE